MLVIFMLILESVDAASTYFFRDLIFDTVDFYVSGVNIFFFLLVIFKSVDEHQPFLFRGLSFYTLNFLMN